jgi:hypothetical protein
MLSRFLDTEEQNIGLFLKLCLFPPKEKKGYTNRAGFPILSSSDRCGLCKKQSLAMTLKRHKAGWLMSGCEFWIHRFHNKKLHEEQNWLLTGIIMSWSCWLTTLRLSPLIAFLVAKSI